MTDLHALPGGALVAEGLADLEAGRETVPALLVSVASTRLRELGLPVAEAFGEAELRLYRRLVNDEAMGAYGHYNSLLRLLVSFARALDREQGARIRAARET